MSMEEGHNRKVLCGAMDDLFDDYSRFVIAF